MKSWFVYIVRCQDDALYTGITPNLGKRIEKHNKKQGSKSVIGHGLPVKLAYFEIKDSYIDAFRREIEIKKMTKGEKEVMVLQSKQFSK